MRAAALLKTLTLVAIAAAAACSNPLSSADGTQIRLRNASTFELTAVTFASGASEVKFARLGPSEVTAYAEVASAYRYGYLDVRVNGERRQLQPIDYVGENVIGSGRFTYVITIDAATRNPSVALVRDD